MEGLASSPETESICYLCLPGPEVGSWAAGEVQKLSDQMVSLEILPSPD